MAIIVIKNLVKSIIVKDLSKTLLHHIQENNIDWMHACGAKGRCTTCKARVLQGMDHLGSLTNAEKRYRNDRLLAENERLACQVFVLGDIQIAVPEECQLPHLNYTDKDI